ncbi:MAG: hypothetical protein KKB50_05320 [Planctomycetes bacterium]|nr:hypothetical protein [Planctomycetota bacterium]
MKNSLLGFMKDIRSVGSCPSTYNMANDVGLAALWDIPHLGAASWEEEQLGDMHKVTATYELGQKTIWYINPEKGWNAERIEFKIGDEVIHEVVCSLKQHGDVWLPETADYYDRGKLVESIRVKSAVLNEPDDPKRFTLADMGVEPGSSISPQHRPVKMGEGLIWNGEDICSRKQWDADVKSGKRQWGPTLRMRNAGETYDRPYETEEQRLRREMAMLTISIRGAMQRHESMWARYVRQFIERYKLNEDQAQQAQTLLKKSQERARQIVTRKRAVWTSLEAQLAHAREQGQKDKVRELVIRIDELRAPIDLIFRNQLKPGLERLPTRAQRRAAEQRASTQPAAAKKP